MAILIHAFNTRVVFSSLVTGLIKGSGAGRPLAAIGYPQAAWLNTPITKATSFPTTQPLVTPQPTPESIVVQRGPFEFSAKMFHSGYTRYANNSRISFIQRMCLCQLFMS